MGVFSRIFRLCKADLHGVMDQLEDKCLLLRQCLREMEESLKAKEEQLENINRSCRQIRRDLDQRSQENQKLQQDLDLAVRKEKDDIARMLIRKRRVLAAGCDQLQKQLEQLEEEKSDIEQTLQQQRLQYDQLKVKAAAFCRQAELRQFETPTVNEQMDYSWGTPTEEEVDLELLQRKEALRQGGES